MSKDFPILCGGVSAFFGLKDIGLYISIGFKNVINIGIQYRIIPKILRAVPFGDSHTEENCYCAINT